MTTPTTSTLLAALIAASTNTNGVITVGETQPFDQVRLYQNPANDTVMTNQSSDGAIDTSTTALVIDGETAPTGLVFRPHLAVLRNVTSDIKLLVDTPVELTLTVDIAGISTELTVEAGNTAVLTLGLIAGIPMIVGSHGFFPVASNGNDAVAGLRLIPLAAHEMADGEYQRFSKSLDPHPVFGMSGFSADLGVNRLDLNNSFVSVSFKVPALSVQGEYFALAFAQADVAEMPSANKAFFQMHRGEDSTSFVLQVLGSSGESHTRELPQLSADEEVTLYFHPRHVRAVYGIGTVWINLSEAEAETLWSGNLFNVITASTSPAENPAQISVRIDEIADLADLPAPPMPI